MWLVIIIARPIQYYLKLKDMINDMSKVNEKSLVVVFPSTFAQNKIPLLIQNIKKILEIKNQQYSSIRKDHSVITIEANDPVFASSAINLLFGIRKVAIARQVKNDFETITSDIAKTGANLLLKGDVFYVKVEGDAKGFLPKDLEMAATSAIITKTVKSKTRPGTEQKHDKLLYAYLTKTNAYICIFTDKGLGGLPYNSHNEQMLCVIYDELSAIACIEAIKQGFAVKIIVCYTSETNLKKITKILVRILYRIVSKKIELEFFKISKTKNYLVLFKTTMNVLKTIAKKQKINHVAIPTTPLIFPTNVINNTVKEFVIKGIIPSMPLGALEDEIYKNAKEVGIEKFMPNIAKLTKKLQGTTTGTVIESQKLTVSAGPNVLYEILDYITKKE